MFTHKIYRKCSCTCGTWCTEHTPVTRSKLIRSHRVHVARKLFRHCSQHCSQDRMPHTPTRARAHTRTHTHIETWRHFCTHAAGAECVRRSRIFPPHGSRCTPLHSSACQGDCTACHRRRAASHRLHLLHLSTRLPRHWPNGKEAALARGDGQGNQTWAARRSTSHVAHAPRRAPSEPRSNISVRTLA